MIAQSVQARLTAYCAPNGNRTRSPENVKVRNRKISATYAIARCASLSTIYHNIYHSNLIAREGVR